MTPKKHGVIWFTRGLKEELRTQWFEQEKDAKLFMASVNGIAGREAEYVRRFDPVADVASFHKKFTINYDGLPRMLDFETLQFRLKFMREELQEYETHADKANFELKHDWINQQDQLVKSPEDQASFTHELAQCLDALMDEMYVVLGTAHLHGFNVYEAWDRVHQANMAKVLVTNPADASEKMKLKISKPPGWEPPKHDDLVEVNIHVFKGPAE